VAEARRSGLLADAGRVLGGGVMMNVIGLATTVITARYLGPRDRGLFQLLTLLPSTLANFGKLGIPQANVYFMRRKGASASDVVSNSLCFALGFGLPMAVVGYLFQDRLRGWFFKDAPAEALLPVLALLPLVLLQQYLLGVAQAQQRFSEYNFQQLMPTVLALFGMLLSLVWLQQGLLAAVLVQAGILAFVIVWLAVRVNRTAKIRLRFLPDLAKGQLAFGAKSYVQTLAATLHMRIDQYMIAAMLDPAQLAQYGIAVKMAEFLLKVPDATGTALFPRLAGASERDAHAATVRVCRMTLALAIVCWVGCAVAGPLVVRLLFGSQYLAAILPMELMLPGIVTMSLYHILTRNFTSRNKQQVNLVAAVIALTTNITLNLVLIPRYGIAGAAVSTAVSYSLAAMVLLAVFVRESGYSVGQVLVVRPAEVMDLWRMATQGRRGAA
jgi:O-antigen/teichoic acid export membrane protein